MAFNEATRVQIPALIHLTRLGYDYFLPLTLGHEIDKDKMIGLVLLMLKVDNGR